MTGTLVARPTTYNGIEMRSRLEARVAAYLDRHGVEWRYEPRAFGAKHGQYLPDFELLNDWFGRAIYLEVRGGRWEPADGADQRRRMETILHSDETAILVLAYEWEWEAGYVDAWNLAGGGGWNLVEFQTIADRLRGAFDYFRLPSYSEGQAL